MFLLQNVVVLTKMRNYCDKSDCYTPVDKEKCWFYNNGNLYMRSKSSKQVLLLFIVVFNTVTVAKQACYTRVDILRIC